MSNFEDDPFRSPDHSSIYDHRDLPENEGRGLIVAVAVINYIFGSVCLTCGLCSGVLGGSLIGVIFAAINNNPQAEPEAKIGAGAVSIAIMAVAGAVVICGLFILLAGYGVQQFREWGRILTVVMAVVSGLLGLVSFFLFGPFGLLQIGYAIFVMVVLLNPRYTRDFK